ncbi:hypothetical protein PSP6_740037 [Paraburkholderia tropica]|nr:hypothetical protein PSP6_740037 [Paraburkholderia tropica]
MHVIFSGTAPFFKWSVPDALVHSSHRWPARSRLGGRSQVLRRFHAPVAVRVHDRDRARQFRAALVRHASVAARHGLRRLDGYRRGGRVRVRHRHDGRGRERRARGERRADRARHHRAQAQFGGLRGRLSGGAFAHAGFCRPIGHTSGRPTGRPLPRRLARNGILAAIQRAFSPHFRQKSRVLAWRARATPLRRRSERGYNGTVINR